MVQIYYTLRSKKNKKITKKIRKPLLIFLKQCCIISMEHKEEKNLADLNNSDLNSLYNSGPELTINFIKYLIDAIEDIKTTAYLIIDFYNWLSIYE